MGRTANRITRGRLQQHFAGRAPSLVERTVVCPRWPEVLDGFRILHLSDFHVGELISVEQATQLVEDLRDIQPNLVAVTGDFIDFHCEGVEPLLTALVTLPSDLGTWGVLGNHDKITDARRFLKLCREAGLPILLDTSARVSIGGQPLRISGIDWDYSVGEVHRAVRHVCHVPPVDVSDCVPDPASSKVVSASPLASEGERADETVGAASSDEPHILLAHHPEAFDAAVPLGVDLVLAGHTHGGQFNLKRTSQRHGGQHLGLGLLTHRYPWGVYGRGDSCLHVTSGVGSWFPFRVNCPAEVVLLEIRGPR